MFEKIGVDNPEHGDTPLLDSGASTQIPEHVDPTCVLYAGTTLTQVRKIPERVDPSLGDIVAAGFWFLLRS